MINAYINHTGAKVGGDCDFLLLDTHFPPKKGFLWDTTQKTEMSQKKTS
jgi:hypothetical protein